MTCIFPYFHFASNRAAKPNSSGPGHAGRNKKTGGRPALERRATATVAEAGVTPIDERKPGVLAATLNRIWTFLKYRSELEKAASDCRSFLVSLSKPSFELNTATSLCPPLPNMNDPGFVELFEKMINETIRKSALEAAANKVSANDISERMDRVFDEARKNCYGRAFRIALEYKKMHAAISAKQPAEANWTLLPKKAGKSTEQTQVDPSLAKANH